MVGEKSLILDGVQVKQKVKRMAFEILENNFKEKFIALVGVEQQGYVLAGMLKKELEAISSIEVKLIRLNIDKANPQHSDVHVDCDLKEIRKRVVVLVDDVLNTGRTFAYALKPFLSVEVKKIETAVLVNRSHPQFPIYAQYSGYELATTIDDHVEVVLGKGMSVYLS